MRSRFMVSRSAAWRFGVLSSLVVGGVAVGGCKNGDGGAASASGSAAVESTPSTGPSAWAKAFDGIAPTLPTHPEAEGRPAPIHPSCANHEARNIASKKYGAAYEKAAGAAAATLVERQRKLDEAYAPMVLGWERARATLAHDLGAGLFLGDITNAFQLDGYPAAGESVAKAAFKDAPVTARMRTALAGGGRAPFECTVAAVGRAADEDFRFGAKSGAAGSPVDWVLCDSQDLVNVALELVKAKPVANAKPNGERATIANYDASPDIADAALRGLLDKASSDPSALVGAKLKVSGVAHVWHFPDAVETASKLALLGAPARIIDGTVAGTWIAAFDHACEARGLGCTEGDGLTAGSVSLAAPPPPAGSAGAGTDVVAHAAGHGDTKSQGLWESAVLAVDPKVELHPSNSPWQNGFFAADPKSAFTLSKPGANGAEVFKVPVPERKSKLVDGWRAEIGKRGGMQPFTCTVGDLGQRARDENPILRAALQATGAVRAEKRDYIDILCTGDENSFDGPIVVSVPTYAAWAAVDMGSDPIKGKVREWKAEHHGMFEPSLREKLADVAAGTVLTIAAAPRLTRYSFNAFGIDSELSGIVWVVDLGGFECPYEGLGCALFDGAKLPVVTVAKLESCAASSYVWPPEPPKTKEDPALAGISPAEPVKADKTRKRKKDGAEQVYIPAGAFARGGGSEGRAVRKVSLSEFWIDRHELTVARYLACVGSGTCTSAKDDEFCTVRESNRELPINCVDRAQATTYCEWVGGVLPTYAQWEKAARGTDARPYPWGWSEPNCAVASVKDGDGPSIASMGCHHRGAAPVAGFAAGASPFGVLDLSGNVWEWVQDGYDPATLKVGGTDPTVKDPSKLGILRGGSFGEAAGSALLHATSSHVLSGALATEGTGFRCANRD